MEVKIHVPKVRYIEYMNRINELECENKQLRELLELERKFSNAFMTMNSQLRKELDEKEIQ